MYCLWRNKVTIPCLFFLVGPRRSEKDYGHPSFWPEILLINLRRGRFQSMGKGVVNFAENIKDSWIDCVGISQRGLNHPICSAPNKKLLTDAKEILPQFLPSCHFNATERNATAFIAYSQFWRWIKVPCYAGVNSWETEIKKNQRYILQKSSIQVLLK